MNDIILTIGRCGPTDCCFDTTVNGVRVVHSIDSDSWMAFDKCWHPNLLNVVITVDHPEYEKLLWHHNNPNMEYS